MRRWSNTYLLIYLFNTLTYFTGFVCVDRPGFPLMAPRSKGFFFVKFVFTVVARCFDEKIVKKNNNKRDVPNKGRTLYEAMQHPKPTESCIQQIRIHRPGFASDFQRNIFFSFLFFVLPLILPLMAPRSKGFVSSSFLLLLLLLICSRSLL